MNIPCGSENLSGGTGLRTTVRFRGSHGSSRAKKRDCDRNGFFPQVRLPDQGPIYARMHYMAC